MGNKVFRTWTVLVFGAVLLGIVKTPRLEAQFPEESFSRNGREEALETVETRDGKRYRGQVVGYDAAAKSYLLFVEGRTVSLPESEILTIHGPLHEPRESTLSEIGTASVAPSGSVPTVEPIDPVETLEDLLEPGSFSSGKSGTVSLQALIAGYRALPDPATSEGLQALEEALEELRSSSPLSAVEPLRRALVVEPDCVAASVLLAAVYLELAKEPENALPLLESRAMRESRLPQARVLLSRTASALGYRHLRDQIGVEAIEGRFHGAERQYRLFTFYRRHDPDRALVAWEEYRRLDPGWKLVGTIEGQAMRHAMEAISRNKLTRAAGLLVSAMERNHYLEDEARPLLIRALERRAIRARAAGNHALALGDFRALMEEVPDRRAEFETEEREIEVLLVKQKLEMLGTAGEARAAVNSLMGPIPDLTTKFRAEVKGAFLDVARNSLSSNGFEAAMIAMKDLKSLGGGFDAELFQGSVRVVEENIQGEDLALALTRLKALEDLVEGGNPFWSRLGQLRRSLADAHRRAWTGQVEQGDRERAVATLQSHLILDPDDLEAKRILAELDPRAGSRPARMAVTGTRLSLDYLSLVPGSRWVYLHGDGSQEIQLLKRADQLEDGKKVYRYSVEYKFADARVPYQKTGSFVGEFYQVSGGSRLVGGERIMKLPALLGDSWTWRRGDIIFQREYVSNDERVHCRAGMFENCLKIKAVSRFDSQGVRSRPVVQWFYYAPGVGLVKIVGETPLDGRELVEYRIGPDTGETTPASGGLGGGDGD